MKQLIKLNGVTVWRLRPASPQMVRVFVAHILILVLCVGPALSLDLSVKESANNKPPASPPKRGPVVSRKPKPIFAAGVQVTSVLAGQSVTQLPDGRSLLIGGKLDNRAVDTVAISDPRSGEPVQVKTRLHHARAWHSATMLPDGRVLVLGGIGNNGAILKSAEIFDPETQSFALLTVPEIAAQAYHTASLLTDGQVLIAGGSGETSLWDFKTKTFRPLAAKLSAMRQKHRATLLFDGNLLLEGGVDEGGKEVTTAELYNTASGSFSFTTISNTQLDQNAPFLAGSLPANGAAEVPIDTFVALRFSKRLRVETLNEHSITLSGTEGRMEAKVVPAESGRLAFVTPKVPLLPGMTYTVSVADAVDETGSMITPASSTFTTKGASEPTGPASDGEEWNPDWTNFKGNWTRKHEDSPWRSLPLLQAAEGVTALAGQVLTLDGKPLENTTLRIADKAVQTDKTGRFLLAPLAAGRQVMVIDGRSASRNKRVYGIFKVGVEITAGKTNPLGYTIWMPRLDTNNVVTLSSPTNAAVKVTNPSIPGLELRLPQGTVIRDIDGKTVTEVSITPIPTNQPPFPLPPNVDVPVYFTIQPGGSQIIPPRAQLIYPNFIGSQPNTRIDFYNYDAAEKGWYIYGRGTVTPDGKQIIPDAGVTLYEFSGAMVAGPSLAPSTFIMCGRGNFAGSGVDLGSGLFVHGGRDLALGGFGSLSLSRAYRPNDTRSRSFGIGASQIYDMYLVGSTFPYTFMDLVGPDGSRIHFNRTSAGTSWTDAVYEAESCGVSSCAVKATIRWNGGGWIVIYEDGTKLLFPEAFGASTPQRAAITGYEDQFGNTLSFVRDSASNLTRITSPSGRWMDFIYDTSNRITQAKDNIGRAVNYSYDASGRLASVTNPISGIKYFTYDTSHRMTQVTDERGIAVLKNEYDSAGRVIKQTVADNTPDPADNPFYTYAYTLDSGGRIVQTDVTDPNGRMRRTTFDANGFTASEKYPLGLAEEQTVTYERQAGTNVLLSVTDSIGRKTAYTYDSVGRLTDVTRMAGTAEAKTTHYGYSSTCACDDVTSITDPLNHSIGLEYDNTRNLTGITDALNNKTIWTYSATGQPLSVRDPVNNVAQLTYSNGELTAVTGPAGETDTLFTDAAGRLLSSRNPLGQSSRSEFDALNRLVKFTDPLGVVTELAYDANGNLLSIKDARNNITSYTYDNLNRVATVTDPLQRVESYEYDQVGNMKKVTDRKGKVTSYLYDSLSRVTLVGFGTTGDPQNPTYESTIAYSYDVVGRVTQITDSTSGSITYAYDNLDNLTSTTTPQGVINYTYDAAGRRTSMTVAGQATVNYTYDNANRLVQITNGILSINFTYDNINRLTSISWQNGITVEYSYNSASHLTNVTYKKDGNVLGDLIYEYDVTGRRTKVSGSFARTGLPASLTSATYGASNRLIQRAGTTLSYDLNGNLINDGTNSYTWNARNQLVSMSGPGLTASFQYDALGRRVNKTVNGVSTNYLYNGSNVVQELSGTTPAANTINGGVDQLLARSDAGGSRILLQDLQGSVLALADDSGVLQTQYTYDPFGNTTTAGAASGNTAKYTGREEDGTGLYYYRARYYSPSMQRFISEDPLGFGGGRVNFYEYVGNDPVNSADPSGLCAQATTHPNLVPGTRQQYVQPFTDAFNEARTRLADPRCRDLFNRPYLNWLAQEDPIAVAEMELYNDFPNVGLDTLNATTYRILPMGAPTLNTTTGTVSVTGAGTVSPNSVFINSQGPFFNIRPTVPGATNVVLDLGTGLNQTQFAAFILLHELGHQVGLFLPDASDAALNRRQSRMVLEACFPGARINI